MRYEICVSILASVLLGRKWELEGNLKLFTQENINEEMGKGMLGEV